ncbi:MAG: YfiR family protein [Candidatus Eisenbacteria sp.]|nr:YfiR family protein [Candidatus Eisenbacteria bacterium]
MKREWLRQACRCAARALLLALLCLAPELCPAIAPAFASTVHLYYEDAFDDVQATQETETEIKAAFLLRFPDFISWRRSPGDTLHIGVTGDDELLGMLLRLAERESQPGLGAPYVIAVTRVTGPAAAQRCEILVLGDAVVPDFLPPLMEVHKAGILTVGVWDEPRGGAIIRLFRDGNRVRFDISQTLAKEAGLRISSKLLNLARERSSRVVRDIIEPARG